MLWHYILLLHCSVPFCCSVPVVPLHCYITLLHYIVTLLHYVVMLHCDVVRLLILNITQNHDLFSEPNQVVLLPKHNYDRFKTFTVCHYDNLMVKTATVQYLCLSLALCNGHIQYVVSETVKCVVLGVIGN